MLAAAILELSQKAARTWDYDGETMIGEGVDLDSHIERALERIARTPVAGRLATKIAKLKMRPK